MNDPRFSLGIVTVTPNAKRKLAPEEIDSALVRHHRGDWGEIENIVKRLNELAITYQFEITSAYDSLAGVRFWIVTASSRTRTTVLLPEDF